MSIEKFPIRVGGVYRVRKAPHMASRVTEIRKGSRSEEVTFDSFFINSGQKFDHFTCHIDDFCATRMPEEVEAETPVGPAIEAVTAAYAALKFAAYELNDASDIDRARELALLALEKVGKL